MTDVSDGQHDTEQLRMIRSYRASTADELEARLQVLDHLLPRQDRASFTRFSVMLLLSVSIATMGLVMNSAAVVIGAMLIAPLMTPIMTFAAALAVGLPRRMAQAGFTVIMAVVASVALSFVLAAIVPNGIIDSEVLGRTSPDVRDLVVAVAAGAAGAYAIARQDLSTSLPGVAVAVALVPPLAAAGVLLEAGRSDLAGGALLLFVTNLLAIVVVGVVVLVATRVVPTVRMVTSNIRVFTVLVAVIVLLAATSLVLLQASTAVARQTDRQLAVEDTVDTWLSGSDLAVENLTITGSVVSVELVGEATPPSAFDLAKLLQTELGDDAEVRLQWTERSEATARVGGNEDRRAATRVIITDWLDSLGLGHELIDIVVGDTTVVADVSGPEPPAGTRAIEELLRRESGLETELVVRWVQRVDLAAGELAPSVQAVAVVDTWIGARGTIRVLNVEWTRRLVTVDLAARNPLLGISELHLAIEEAFPETAVSVRVTPLVAITPTEDVLDADLID